MTDHTKPTARALAWHQANKWFGKDVQATKFAIDVHEHLVDQGVDPNSDDYYLILYNKLHLAKQLGLINVNIKRC